MDYVAGILKDNPSVSIELAGHTDNTGDADANLILSQSRADAVMNYLVQKGIDAARLSSQGYGDSAPIDSNETDEGRTNNRRTELKIISK